MAGRVLFAKWKTLLRVIETLYSFIPHFIVSFFYTLSYSFEGRLSLFIRYLYLRRFCAQCGTNVFVGRSVVLKNIETLSLGSNVSIHSFSYIDAKGIVSIGDDVSIAHSSSIVSFEHSWEEPSVPIKYNALIEKPVVIENDVWIGAGVRVLSGAVVATRSIVAAGSVVKGRFAPRSLLAKVPAVKIKSL